MNLNGQKKQLIEFIGEEKYRELVKQIPKKFEQDIQLSYSAWLLGKTPNEILGFYQELLNDSTSGSILKETGMIVISTTHINNLLVKLIEKSESDEGIRNKAMRFNFHYLILFCKAKYNIPDDEFQSMMELKHFRNMISHEFDSTMETSFNQALHPIMEAQMLVISLTEKIRRENNKTAQAKKEQ